MEPDCEICLCFHVTRRKLIQFARVERPAVASQLAQCGGAGTGCGWCVPFVQQIFEEVRGQSGPSQLTFNPEEYRRQRAEYVRTGKRKPPSAYPADLEIPDAPNPPV
ncbi:MAG: (2Fe-2S)-binding protein [Gemmataceae bacterium]|nr:(2Fe-2S)-binding protein [Gemmataceae bacterium]